MAEFITNGQMREADAYTIEKLGVPSEELMRRAGTAIADEVEKLARGKSVLVVCGSGNNGGDGFVCARVLKERGAAVRVFDAGENYSDDCLREKSRYNGAYTDEIEGDIIVDCLFGTGLNRAVGGKYGKIIAEINACGAFVVSADIPSGLCGDNGRVLGSAVKADLTVAIEKIKCGCVLGDGLDFCGKITVKPIGVVCNGDYLRALDDGEAAAFYPARKRNTHKGSYGCALLIAGSDRYVGAAALAAQAAAKSGCGYVKLRSSEKVEAALVGKLPQIIYGDYDLNAQSIAIGMGRGATEETYAEVKYLLSEYRGSLIIDADGLNALAKFGADALLVKKCTVLVTPHVKEFSRLTGASVDEILSDPVNYARGFAEKYGVCVLLKSAASVITDGKTTVLNLKGNSALAKGGSGDMLSGYIAGSVARGLSLFDGAVCGAYTLGLAAEIAAEAKTEYCATAKDIINNLHNAVKRLTGAENADKI